MLPYADQPSDSARPVWLPDALGTNAMPVRLSHVWLTVPACQVTEPSVWTSTRAVCRPWLRLKSSFLFGRQPAGSVAITWGTVITWSTVNLAVDVVLTRPSTTQTPALTTQPGLPKSLPYADQPSDSARQVCPPDSAMLSGASL